MATPPDAVLFACNLNRVRSPIAAALLRRRWGDRVFVDSCGLRSGESVDPFVVAVMGEIGLDLSTHAPKTFDALDDAFDLVISLTPQAHARATALAGSQAQALLWTTPDPTIEGGSREQRLASYRAVRDQLDGKIAALFPRPFAREG